LKLGTMKRLDYFVGGALIALARPFVLLTARLLRRDHDPRPRGSIVVVKLMGGGSLLLAAPALLGIKRAYPTAPLSLLTTRRVAPFAALLGLFDHIVALDDRSFLRLAASAARSWPRLLGADTVIDLEVYSRFSTVLALLTLARNRIGFYLEAAFWRRGLHTQLLFFNRFSNVHGFYDGVARLLGAAPATREDCERRLRDGLPAALARTHGRRRLALGHACSELGRERMLSAEQWRVLLARRDDLAGAELHVLGGAEDQPAAEALIAACAPQLPSVAWHDQCGQIDLAGAVALLASCDEFIGIDSALLHFARLLGVPTTSFWGPTDPATRLQPFPGARDVAYYHKIACSPCIHVAEEPPCRGRNLCMAALIEPPPEGEQPMWMIEG
jgi:ADP-heptose:LPS heptosyltransferase